MKKLLSIAMAFGVMIMTDVVCAQSEQTGTVYTQPDQAAVKAPPVSQELVREGDFALKLATALKLGSPETEVQAEDMLMSAGIAPKNGWIADYPMTPIIIGQVRNSVVAAGALKKLPTGRDEALQVFDGLTDEFGLSISAEPGQYAETPPPTNNDYLPPPEIETYYNQEGPPVVTYYPPPWDYSYLYAWVPYPFWCSGFFFPGFFVLNDFHHHHHHHGSHDGHHDGSHDGHHDPHGGNHMISNHFIDPKTHVSLRVDPTTKTTGIAAARGGALRSWEASRAAASILNRGVRSRTFQPPDVGRYQSIRGTRTGLGRSFGSSTGRSFGGPSPRSFGAPSTGGRSSFGHAPSGGVGGFHGGGSHGTSHGGGHS